MSAESPSPISPSPNHKIYPSVDGSGRGLGDGSGCSEEQECDEALPVAEDDVEFDAEDIQPVKSLNTPEMPSRAVVE